MTDLTYADYLQTGTLLALQEPRTPATAERSVVLAEHFFIVAHQCCELLLKQLLADLDTAASLLLPPTSDLDLEEAVELLHRGGSVLRVLHEQVLVLERMPVRYFAEFRPYLGTASGAQSAQFRALGRLLGTERDPSRLFQAFEAAVQAHGTSVVAVCRSGAAAGSLHRVAEVLIDLGNGFWRWKMSHLALVSAMVGPQAGTGGTTGADFLARRVTQPFPQLRIVHGQLHDFVPSAD